MVYLIYLVLLLSYHFSYADGNLDPSFGTGGLVVTPFGTSSGIIPNLRNVRVQPDGKIVAVGVATTGAANDFALARYNPDGSLDTTLNGTGLVSTNFNGFSSDQAFGSVIQPDGKIVAVGFTDALRVPFVSDFALARYNPDGSLDTTFGTGGLVVTQFTVPSSNTSQAFAVVLQPDGKIIAAGRSPMAGMPRFALTRYNTNGSLDTTFGTGGMVTTAFSGSPNDRINAVLLQPDGKIVAVGFASGANFALARYNINGSLDTTFGSGGTVVTNIAMGNDQITSALLQPDGKIVAAGFANISGNQFALARYNTNGSLDTTFGSGGTLTTIIPGGTASTANGVLLQADGKIVAVGFSTISSVINFVLVRYMSNGSVDTTFGSSGFVTTPFPGSTDSTPFSTAMQADGKIIAAGYTIMAIGGARFALARYYDCSTLVGSDTVVQLFNNARFVGGNGRIAKLAIMQGGFALCGNATFDSCFPVVGPICLECYSLTLANDIIMHNIAYLGSLGNIVGNGHVLSLAQSVSTIPNYSCADISVETNTCAQIEWGNLVVELNSDVTLQDTEITFTGISTLQGNGNILTLGDSAALIVGENAQLTMQNITIDGVNANNIRCVNDQSLLELENVRWNLDANYTFATGRMKVGKKFYINGPEKLFSYQSDQITTIESNGRLIIGQGVEFYYAPSMALQNLLSLVDSSSQLVLKGSTLRVSNIGINLLRGILKIARDSSLISEGSNLPEGIHFGDGSNANNNLDVQITPAAQLFITGPVIYQNV